MSSIRKRKACSGNDDLTAATSRKQTKITHTLPAAKANVRPTKLQAPAPKQDEMKQSPKEQLRSEHATVNSLKRKRHNDRTTQASDENQGTIQREIMTPPTKRFRNALPPSPAETPSKRTAKLFDRLDLEQKHVAYSTPPATPEGLKVDFVNILPPQLVDFVSLYAALLAAINEQAALSCSDFRINVKDLLTVTTNIWNKRDVSITDVRRLLAVQEKSDLGWSLEDYGRAGLSLVQDQNVAKSGSVSILDTIKSKKSFENEVRRMWAEWQKNYGTDADPITFISQLPQVAILANDSVGKAALLSSRGRDRLSSIKKAQAAAQTAETEAKATEVIAASVSTRGTSLLDRILAKQAYNASMPAGPTKDQLQRRSCIQRIEEIARVLDILSAGRPRASFGMQSVVQQLQQSLKTPISRIDAEHCLSIMASEVMPRCVSIIASGTVNGIVITRAGKPGLADLKKRLADLDI